MADRKPRKTRGGAGGARLETRTQVSAGGVPFLVRDGKVHVALIAVGSPPRWQLPKGLVEPGESPDVTAVREAREETGLDTEIVGELERIEYWYQATERGTRVRFHKFVHFFLLAVRGGDVSRHDAEVSEARVVAIADAIEMLAFANEKRVLRKASELIDRARQER